SLRRVCGEKEYISAEKSIEVSKVFYIDAGSAAMRWGPPICFHSERTGGVRASTSVRGEDECSDDDADDRGRTENERCNAEQVERSAGVVTDRGQGFCPGGLLGIGCVERR